jgi:phosphoribosylformylglycinamidine synthase I
MVFMKVAVIQFPGSNCDQDVYHSFARGIGVPTEMIWHKGDHLGEVDLVVIPGGFSYGDYLRCGAIARFSPIMKAVSEYADRGGLILGICNGFQILCEAGLLPGALIRNNCLEYRCMTPHLLIQDSTDSFNRNKIGQIVRLPIGHGEGNYRIDDGGLNRLEMNNQVLLRYCDEKGNLTEEANPNGSINNIAGIRNERGNIYGMMPHPDRAFERFHPSMDGLPVMEAVLATKNTLTVSV